MIERGTNRPTNVRHVVLGLTVAAYLITYMDRVNIASAVPVIQKELGFSMVTVGWILGSFRWGYALFQIPGGWLGDSIGPRPRSLSRWILPGERGFAQGITHAGSRLGAALTPTLVVLLMAAYGWRAPFFVFGFIGLFWAALWYWYYRDTPQEHASVNEAERNLIVAAVGGARAGKTRSVPWRQILASSTLWTLSAMYFCYAYCIAVYLDWFPKYLNEHRGFDLKHMGMYASLPLLAGTAGDLLGGWASDRWARRTGDLKTARRGVAVAGFLLAAAGILPATFTASPTGSVWYTCIAVFGLETTVGVSWAIPLDIGGDYAGSVSAVMNTCGNIGGAISPTLLPYLVRFYGWNVPFVVASALCVAAAILFSGIDATKRIFAEHVTAES